MFVQIIQEILKNWKQLFKNSLEIICLKNVIIKGKNREEHACCTLILC